MAEVWMIVAGALVASLMGALKSPLAWLRRQPDIVKSLVVLVIAGALYFGLKAFGVVEGSGAEIPIAALVAMGVREVAAAAKNVFNETEEEKERRLTS